MQWNGFEGAVLLRDAALQVESSAHRPLPGGGGGRTKNKKKTKKQRKNQNNFMYFFVHPPPPRPRTLFLRAPTILKRPPSRGRVAQSMFRFLGVAGAILACAKTKHVVSRFTYIYIYVCVCVFVCTYMYVYVNQYVCAHTQTFAFNMSVSNSYENSFFKI